MHRSTSRDAVVVPIATHRKDRRFICGACGVKWHVPAERSREPDPVRCGSCGGVLKAYAAPAD